MEIIFRPDDSFFRTGVVGLSNPVSMPSMQAFAISSAEGKSKSNAWRFYKKKAIVFPAPRNDLFTFSVAVRGVLGVAAVDELPSSLLFFSLLHHFQSG